MSRDEIERLTGLYITNGIIPVRKIEDALHIAISVVNEIDIFLSWNYKHLANINKEMKIIGVNILEGYTKPFKMVTPLEIMYEDE